MAFRRIVLTTENIDKLEEDINRLFSLNKMKIDFPNLKYIIKQGTKPNTLIVDLNGEGADSVSKKIKDAGVKHGAQVNIKLEKPMGNVQNQQIKESIKKVLKEMYDDDSIKGHFKDKDSDDYIPNSSIEIADGNINIKNMKSMVNLGKGLVQDLLNSGYWSKNVDEQECVELVVKLLLRDLSSEYNIPVMNISSMNEIKKKKK